MQFHDELLGQSESLSSPVCDLQRWLTEQKKNPDCWNSAAVRGQGSALLLKITRDLDRGFDLIVPLELSFLHHMGVLSTQSSFFIAISLSFLHSD